MMRIRATGFAVLLALTLAGCSTVVSGRAQPADHNGPVAVPEKALRGALLDGGELDDVMDASGIEKRATREDLSADSAGFSDPSCLAAWQPIQESVYEDSGSSSVRATALYDHDDSESSEHLVVEAVVGYPSRTDVGKFFDEVKPQWESCGDREFTSRTSDGTETRWDFGAVASTDSTLSVTRTQQRTNGWSCQHVLRATNNVIIDALACAYDVGDDGVKIADAIDAKLPSV